MELLRRAALWLIDHPVGQAALGITCAVIVFAPGYWFGLGWGFCIAAAALGFVAGWAAARRYWRKNGYVSKL